MSKLDSHEKNNTGDSWLRNPLFFHKTAILLSDLPGSSPYRERQKCNQHLISFGYVRPTDPVTVQFFHYLPIIAMAGC